MRATTSQIGKESTGEKQTNIKQANTVDQQTNEGTRPDTGVKQKHGKLSKNFTGDNILRGDVCVPNKMINKTNFILLFILTCACLSRYEMVRTKKSSPKINSDLWETTDIYLKKEKKKRKTSLCSQPSNS